MPSFVLFGTTVALLTAGVIAALLPLALGQAVLGLTVAVMFACKPRWLISP